MAKLVGVYHDESREDSVGRIRKTNCLARRQLPLTIEPGLTMIMALDDVCLACGCGASSNVSTPSSGSGSPTDLSGIRLKNGVKDAAKGGGGSLDRERESFLRKYQVLGKGQLSVAFTVSFDDFLVTLSNEVPCVGCRRSVEALMQKLYETCDSALEPLVIREDAVISVRNDHIVAPHALANLFCVQSQRLENAYFVGLFNSKGKKNNKVGGRCSAHSLGLGIKKLVNMGYWLDTWECMERECQEEVVLIHFDLLRQTLDRYLKKHSFCIECTNMVNKAYNLLVHGDVAGDLASDCQGHVTHHEDMTNCGDHKKKNQCCGTITPSTTTTATTPVAEDKSSKNLYLGITACTADLHVHVECNPTFISKLITMAEPELSGLRQERHAKTIEIAQKEVLTCIGICLYERFQRIHQRLREGQQSCDLLFLIALKSLKKSFEMAFENQQGISDLEKLCIELDEEERKKQEKAQKKRDRKSKQTAKRKKEKELELELELEQKKLEQPFEQHEHRPNRTRLPSNKELPSLESMLKVGDDDEENFIPLEDIQEFMARMPVVNRQREELRRNLRQRFNQLCVNGL